MIGQSHPQARTLLARAKVNLCLHVGARRADGLHDLSSLAVYPNIGDPISILPSDELTLTLGGPFAAGLSGLDPASNLVFRAARALQQATGCTRGAAIHLTKCLPPASGIGGGTADAAAVLVLLRDMWGLSIDDAALMRLAFRLGADGPLCLAPYLLPGNSAVMTGAGETVVSGPVLPPLWLCLVNPGVGVSTGEIFRRFDRAGGGRRSCALALASRYENAGALGAALAGTANDLAPPARALCPAIARVEAFLAARPGAIMARMSGSGATCFALFADGEAAGRCARAARGRGWWAQSGAIGSPY